MFPLLVGVLPAAVAAGLDIGSLGVPLRIETTFETNFVILQNPDLDDATSDELSVLRPELSVELDYRASDQLRGLVELEADGRLFVTQGGDRSPQDDEGELNLKQLYLELGSTEQGLSLRVGRQEFADEREWLYDEDMDGVRAFYRRRDLSVELSASRNRLFRENLLKAGGSEDAINNYMLYVAYQLEPTHRVGAYILVRDDRLDHAEGPTFLGVRATGAARRALDYWLELAQVRGRSGARTLRGLGFDLGGTYRFDAPMTPSITLALAFGSGDSDPHGRVDRRFRQTGLEDNSHRFNGVENFRYYGETLNPELSNLALFTAGLGIRPSPRSSVDVVFHQYRQDVSTRGRIEGARVRARTNGTSRDVGRAVDLILGYHEVSGLRLRAKLGYFMPGRAFGDDAGDAYSVEMGVEYRF